ncbi:MAG: DUF6737 family protein [Leptolyngbya sp. BL-A-14]
MQKHDSVWSHKPWWCQPWSILLTGGVLIGGSWGLTRMVWLTVLVAVPVVTWMVFFLLVYPRLMMQMEASNGVASGQESGNHAASYDAGVQSIRRNQDVDAVD